MKQERLTMRAVNTLCIAMASLFAGCGDGGGECASVGEECAGVPAGAICGESTCTEGVQCGAVIEVSSDADLQSKVKEATSGDCIALAPGKYGAVMLPGGVSLLGRSAADVKVESVTLSAGEGAVLRGLEVGAAGVALRKAAGVRIESVRVTGSAGVRGDGINLDEGSSAAVITSTVEGSSGHGIYAKDADVTLDRSLVTFAQAAGVWVEGSHCDADCGCTKMPLLTMTKSLLDKNHRIGLSLRGAAAELTDVDVTDTRPGDAVDPGGLGGGIAAAACSSLHGARLRVQRSADWGILIDSSAARLGGEGEGETVEIDHNNRGLWIQNVKESAMCSSPAGCVTLHHGTVTDNLGVGIGVAGESRGIVLCKSAVTGTLSVKLPVVDESGMIGGSREVGDGLDWLDGSQVRVEALELSDNERQSVLIDGPATGEIQSVTLSGGEKAMLQQNLMGGTQIQVGSGVTLTTEADRKLAVPRALNVSW